MNYLMKTSFYCFCLLIFLLACNSTKNTKTADAEKTVNDSTLVSIDSSSISSEFGFVDTIPQSDTVVFIEPKNPLAYMTIEEKGMIDEINLLRADPQAYSAFVDGYLQQVVNDPSTDAATKTRVLTAAGKLILNLQSMEPLPALLPKYYLHQIAKMHGKEMVMMKTIDPVGSDGIHLFQRIREDGGMDGTENLIVGRASTRETILSLLIEGIDSGINQGQNFLDNQWVNIACYQAGKVGEVENVWVQLFAYPIEEDEDEYLPEEVIEQKEQPVEEMVVAAEVVKETTAPEKAADYSFMTSEEKQMVDEINLMRSNPEGYIPFVDAYVKKYEMQYSANDKEFKKAVEELKTELKQLEPLIQLEPNKILYNVARNHGLDNKRNNRLDHIGSDKSDPFDRVRRSGLKNSIDEKGYFAPNENLVGGEDTPRESVVALLIDSGVSSRGHRRALLEPKWKYVACYKIGTIENMAELKGQEMNDMNNCWVQLFAKD